MYSVSVRGHIMIAHIFGEKCSGRRSGCTVPPYVMDVESRRPTLVADGIIVDIGRATAALQFVLAASGHIAGVINPASKNRRNYWLGGKLVKDPERWLKAAQSHPGSWWTHWSAWLEQHAGERVAAPAAPGNAAYRAIEPAPGRYVKEPARKIDAT